MKTNEIIEQELKHFEMRKMTPSQLQDIGRSFFRIKDQARADLEREIEEKLNFMSVPIRNGAGDEYLKKEEVKKILKEVFEK